MTVHFRRILILCLVVSMAWIWGSCGSNSGGSQDGITTLRYMRWGVLEELEAEKELLAVFEKENPDIRIQLEVSNWNEYWRKLQAMFSAHSAPDVFLMGGEYLYDYVDKGVIKGLNEQVKTDEFDLSKYFSNPVEIFTWRGELWGLPRDCNTVVVFYNKDLFAQAGIPEPHSEWTWDDFLSAAQKLTQDLDGDGETDQWGYMVGHDSAEVRFAHFIWQSGGQILNPEKTECLIGEPSAIRALQFLHDLIHKHKVAPPLPKLSAVGGNYFLTGKMGMDNEGSWMLRFYRKIEKFDWDVAPLPKDVRKAAPVNGLANVIYQQTKHPEAAWRLLKFLSGPLYQEKLAESGTSIPALKEIAYSDAFLKSHPKPKNIQVFLDQLEYAQPIDFTLQYSRWDLEFRKQLELAFLGQKPVEDACKDGERKVNEILQKTQSE